VIVRDERKRLSAEKRGKKLIDGTYFYVIKVEIEVWLPTMGMKHSA
jgi:hypothetical protein